MPSVKFFAFDTPLHCATIIEVLAHQVPGTTFFDGLRTESLPRISFLANNATSAITASWLHSLLNFLLYKIFNL